MNINHSLTLPFLDFVAIFILHFLARKLQGGWLPPVIGVTLLRDLCLRTKNSPPEDISSKHVQQR